MTAESCRLLAQREIDGEWDCAKLARAEVVAAATIECRRLIPLTGGEWNAERFAVALGAYTPAVLEIGVRAFSGQRFVAVFGASDAHDLATDLLERVAARVQAWASAPEPILVRAQEDDLPF